MAFSQSFVLGENTLNRLDEVNIPCVNRKKPITSTRKREQKPLNGITISNGYANQSPTADTVSAHKLLEVVDESPTEKTNMFGTSIRERLKNASTSKKNNRKHMRRSRSDPITASDSKISKSSTYKPSFSEEFGSMFDSSMEYEDSRANKKTNIKLDEKFGEDDFDAYIFDLQTPTIQKEANDTKSTNSLIVLSDSGGSDQVNLSEVERLMRTEDFDKTADSPAKVDNEEPKDKLEWEDSAFFNDLLTSQKEVVTAEPELFLDEHDDIFANMVIDGECVSMLSGQIEDAKALEADMESCFLEMSIQLSETNATEAKSMHKTASQFETSMFSRSISERVASVEVPKKTDLQNNLSLARPNTRSIDNLADWGCSPSIIKAYKKKGIHEMFQWQVECLSNPKV